MFAIEEGIQKVNGEYVDTFSRDITGVLLRMRVEAGTNGLSDDPERHGNGRTYVSMVCEDGDMRFEPVMNEKGLIAGVKITCCGDSGLRAMIEASSFIKDALEDLARELHE